MCGIVDANVVHEVFGPAASDAGTAFFDWIDSGKGSLISGGRHADEIQQSSPAYRRWARVARVQGRLRFLDAKTVEAREAELEGSGLLASDDAHVMALAQLSGARLLYTNDRDLQQDFKNRNLIDNPRGKIYTTKEKKVFTKAHRSLLGRVGLCGQQPR